jgi:hypothetical protein
VAAGFQDDWLYTEPTAAGIKKLKSEQRPEYNLKNGFMAA